MNRSHLTLLVALPALVGALQAQDEGSTADAGTSIFGEPLVVNGRRITDLEIKRFLCYGKGRNALESRKLGVLMNQERELRQFEAREGVVRDLFAGQSYDELADAQRADVDAKVSEELAYLQVREGALEEQLKERVDSFTERYPSLDVDTETRRAYESVDWYESQVLQTLEFDQMFYPGHPDDWPAISIEAIQAGAPNVDLLADYAKYYEQRLAVSLETGEPVKREEEMMMGILRDYVIGALVSLVDIETMTDGLPPDVLMTVDGGGFRAELMTEDVYEEMKHAFSAKDIYDAKLFLALQAATHGRLVELGALMPREEYIALVAEWRDQLEGSIFNWNFLALQGHQFPSEEAYVEHTHLIESFKKHIAPEITRDESNSLTPELTAHLPAANVIMGLGKCTSEVLLVSAYDFQEVQWKENGWAEAEQRALKLRAEIDDYIDKLIAQSEAQRLAVSRGENYEPDEELVSFDEFWSNMLDLNSDYWDPPLPLTGHMPPALGLKNKGRFQGEPMTRNDYKRTLGESAYYHYLYNNSVCDTVFYDLEPGTVGGPYEGAYGYYIVYLRERLAPTNPLDVMNDRHFGMLVEDYARVRYTAFAHEALAKAEVQGLEF